MKLLRLAATTAALLLSLAAGVQAQTTLRIGLAEDPDILDPTLARLDRTGLTVKSSFDIKPGTYLVRMVVRDGEGSQMAAKNGAVTIPY